MDFIKSLGSNANLSYGLEYVYNDVESTGVGEDVVCGEYSVIVVRYRPYSCGISAPGRNISMSVTYNL